MTRCSTCLCLFCFAASSSLAFAACTEGSCIESTGNALQASDEDAPALSMLQKRSHETIGQRQAKNISRVIDRYFDAVRDTLTGAILRTDDVRPGFGEGAALTRVPFNEVARWQGIQWCDGCFTMAGGARVQNVRDLMTTTINEGIPGDFLEAGTWRGGCSIMARVVQRTLDEDGDRRTYVCDSFSGLPPSSQKSDDDSWSKMNFLEVSQEEVADNFKRFQALDDSVFFRKGFFSNSLPVVRQELLAQGRQLAVLRGDGDMYESFMDILYNLYEFVPVGGYFICDDCPKIRVAQQAIEDFRKEHGITEPIVEVEGSSIGSFWRKTVATPVNYTKYLEWNATRAFRSKDVD